MKSGICTAKTGSAAVNRMAAAFMWAALLVMLAAPGQAVFSQRYSEWSVPENLGPVINTTGFDGCPSLSRDGLTLLYMSNIGSSSQNIYVSQRETNDPDSAWGPPESLGPAINTASSSEICPLLSNGGRYLYFASDRPGGCGNFDIYVARRLNKESWTEWGEPANLGCDVNSAGPEFSPSLFEDESGSVYLYFSSGLRPGGMGFGDVWFSAVQFDGSFGPAQPAVELNSTANDIRPKIRARDGLEIFFDSNRPGTLGLQDLYTSTRECTHLLPECAWSAPVNMGPIVNAGALDGGPALSFDGTELYFMSDRSGGSGGQDLWVSRRKKLTGHEGNDPYLIPFLQNSRTTELRPFGQGKRN